MTTARSASADSYLLAEGPVWDAERGRLLWVDILAGAILRGRLDGRRVETTGRIDIGGMVGAVAVAADGGLLVAAQEQLVALPVAGERVLGPRIIAAGEHRRLNDGAVDPDGRFLVGTLSLEEDPDAGGSDAGGSDAGGSDAGGSDAGGSDAGGSDAGGSEAGGSDGDESGREVLVRLERDGSLTELDADLTLSNGLAWSTDGTTMFSVDTLRHTVFVRDYDRRSGVVGDRRVHLHIDGGFPDGIAVDAADHLWVAVWGAGEVRRFAPDGELVDRIVVPAPHTSSVAFAGDDLRTLVITTATDGLTGEQRRDFPDSGRLFTARVDVPGCPVPAWSGATFR